MTQPNPFAGDVDLLSPLAKQLMAIDLHTAYTRLTVHGAGNAAAREQLRPVEPQQLIVTFPASRDDARCLLSGLWLWHDWLDESHRIAQEVHSPNGSFWHAIMHRREGDFSNSKYWFARVGADHPLYPALASNAASIINPQPADKLLLKIVANGWNPNALVDLVEAVHHNPNDPRHATAVSLQQLEWRLLFDHCARTATRS